MKRARKGSGSIYRTRYEKAGTLVWGGWRVRYRWNGRKYDKAVPADRPQSKQAAQEFLKQEFAKHASGEFADVGAEKLRYADLRDGLLRYYEVNEKKSLLVARDGKTRYLSGQSHLDEFFGALPGKPSTWNPRALDISTGAVEEFKRGMKQKGASNANINLSLGLLRQMFNIAIEEKKFTAALAPNINKLKNPDARKGFVEPDDFASLEAALPDDLRPVARLGFDTGMRLGEISNLRWAAVDLTDQGEINLNAEDTKTDVARTVPLGRNLATLRMMRAKNPKAIYVFGGDRPLGDFRKRWYDACVAAKLGSWAWACVKRTCGEFDKAFAEYVEEEKIVHLCSSCGAPGELKYFGRTFHDLRRSAVRNMVRSGISERVAMSISGHRTRAVFDRYNITSTDDLHEAARRQNQWREDTIVQRRSKIADSAASESGDDKLVTQ